MPSEGTNISQFNRYWKSNKTLSIIYADLDSLIKKIDRRKNNSEKLPTTKIGKHIICGYSMLMHDVHRGMVYTEAKAA